MDEVIKIIKIETGGSEQTVKGLKEEISSLRDALLNVEKGSEEYKNILDQLIDDQKRLTDVMNAGVKEAKAAEGSYNALVNQMAALKKVWRETTDEASRKELGKQINSINDKLKEYDKSIGDFRRNVGNYSESVTTAFASMGGAAKGMVGPLNSVKQVWNALTKHPLITVLTALAALLINGIAKGFKNSEEAANKTKVAFAALQGVADYVNKAFEKVAMWIANVTEKAVALLEKLKWLSPELKKSMEDRKKIAEDEIKLDDKRRDNIKKNANLEKEAAELRANAADKDKYTAQERLTFLEQAEQKELEIANNEVESLKLEWDIAKQKLEISKDNAELKQIEAEAEAKYIAAKTAYAQKLEASRKAISSTRKEMVRDARQAEQALLNLQKDLIQQEYDLAKDGSQKQLDLAKEQAKIERDIAISSAKEKIKNREQLNRALKLIDDKYQRTLQELEVSAVNRTVENERNLATRRLNTYIEGSVEYYKTAKDEETKIHNLYSTIIKANGDLSDEAVKLALSGFENALELTETLSDKSLENIKDLESESLKALKNMADNLTRAEEKQVEVLNQIVLNGTRPMSRFYDTQFQQLMLQYQDMVQYFNEEDDDFKARRQAKWKEIIDALSNRNSALIEEEQRFMNLFRAEQYNGMNYVDEELASNLKKYNVMWNDTMSSIKNVVLTDADNIVQSLAEHGYGYAFRKLFEKELSPENLKDVLYSSEEDFKTLMNLLTENGLIPETLIDTYIESLRGMADAEKAILDYRYHNWDDLAKGIADLSKGISDIYAINLENQKKKLEKEGKYTEQERKNLEQRYKTVQAMQIAEATINTISGAVAAFMKCQELGQPWGAILGAVQAAAVTAAGIAQIMKIKQTNPYSDNSSSLSGGDMMTATVQPTVSDFTPEYSQNLTGRSDIDYLNDAFSKTPIWVSVVDVNNAQERGRVIVKESSF